MDGTPDSILLQRWRQNRDAPAFAEIVARYSGMVYSTCRRILGAVPDADEVTQDCFLAMEKANPRAGKYLGPWLYRVAVRRALNCLRSAKRRREREHRFWAEHADEGRRRGQSEILGYVDEAISGLSDKLRAPVVLHFVEGRTQEEAAKALGLPRTTVTTRITRGIEEIRKKLKRRGVPVSAAALTALLGSSLTEAVPPALTAALGKLALAGSAASGAKAAAGWILATKVTATCVVVAVGVIAAIRMPTRPTRTPKPPAEESAAAEPDEISIPQNKGTDAVSTPPGRSRTKPIPTKDIVGGGLVVDHAGQPVPGAQIVVSRDGKPVERTRANADGGFQCAPVTDERHELYAFKPGIGLAVVPDIASYDLAEPVTLKPLGCIGGRVYDRETGKGIAGLLIRIQRLGGRDTLTKHARHLFDEFRGTDALGEGESYQKTDKDGRYLFDDCLRSKYGLGFMHYASDYAFPRFGDAAISPTLDAGERLTNFDIALLTGGTISGTVRDPYGNPIPEAKVCLLGSKQWCEWSLGLMSTQDGTFCLRGLPKGGSYTVCAKHKDYAFAWSKTVDLVDTQELTGVDVQLSFGHAVYGRLEDDRGKPIGGARIDLRWTSVYQKTQAVSVYQTKTQADGSFVFARVGPGEQAFSVSGINRAAYNTARPFEFVMPQDADLNDLVVVLKRKASGFITGRVTDDSDRPLAWVTLKVNGSTTNNISLSSQAYSDTNGVYRLKGLGGGRHLTVDAIRSRHEYARHYNVAVNSTGVDFTLYRCGRLIGKVLDATTGNPNRQRGAFHHRLPSARLGSCPCGMASRIWNADRPTYSSRRLSPGGNDNTNGARGAVGCAYAEPQSPDPSHWYHNTSQRTEEGGGSVSRRGMDPVRWRPRSGRMLGAARRALQGGRERREAATTRRVLDRGRGGRDNGT